MGSIRPSGSRLRNGKGHSDMQASTAEFKKGMKIELDAITGMTAEAEINKI